MTDATIRQAQAGEPEAMLTLWRALQPVMRAVARAILRDPNDVDDAVANAWLNIMRALPRYDHHGRLAQWAGRITCNCAKDVQGRPLCRKWHDPRTSNWSAVEEQLPGTLSELFSAPEPGPAQIAERQQDANTLKAAVARLPRPQRIVVELFLAERSHEEIAAAAQCPVGTVKSRLHYAKAAMRREVTP